jgi:hypothetical protein
MKPFRLATIMDYAITRTPITGERGAAVLPPDCTIEDLTELCKMGRLVKYDGVYWITVDAYQDFIRRYEEGISRLKAFLYDESVA